MWSTVVGGAAGPVTAPAPLAHRRRSWGSMMNQPQISHSEVEWYLERARRERAETLGIEWYLERARRERAQTIARFLRVGIARTASALRWAAARVAQRFAPRKAA